MAQLLSNQKATNALNSIRHASPASNRRCIAAPVRCMASSGQDADESRRDVMAKIAISIVSGAALSISEPAEAAALPGFKKDLKNKRRAEIPESDYKDGPSGLKYYDLVVGTGAEAKQGARVAAHLDVKWRGVTFVTTRQGMGVTGGTPLGFDVGSEPGRGGTLKGVDLAVRGMRVGGQRRVLIPPSLAYGSKGYGEIPPNATLTADIQLLSIKQNAIGSRVKLVEG